MKKLWIHMNSGACHPVDVISWEFHTYGFLELVFPWGNEFINGSQIRTFAEVQDHANAEARTLVSR